MKYCFNCVDAWKMSFGKVYLLTVKICASAKQRQPGLVKHLLVLKICFLKDNHVLDKKKKIAHGVMQ